MIELYKVDKIWILMIELQYNKDLNIWITFMLWYVFASSADCDPPIEGQHLGLILLILNI